MRSLIGGLRNKIPVPVSTGVSRMSTSMLSQNDSEGQMKAMGAVGTLFAIVHRISTAVGQVDWHLYRKAASGDEDDRVEVTSHPALDLWMNPNPFYSQNEFLETHQQHMDLTGEAWWVFTMTGANGNGFPTEIWPIRPDKMQPVPSPTDFLTGYIYTGPRGEQIPLPMRQVIQHKLPNPLDPYRGMGPVQSLLVDLDSMRYSAAWNRNFFLNSATPGGIIQINDGVRLSDDEFDEMTKRWNEQHQGISNAHRVAVIEQGTWIERSYSMRDMQFTELRATSRDTVMEAFGLGRPMLGITEDVNRANADAAEYVFSKYITTSRLERIKIKLNKNFLPLFGASTRGLEFDYDTPIAEDIEAANATLAAQALAVLNLVNAGAEFTSACAAVGLPEIDKAEAITPAPQIALPAGADLENRVRTILATARRIETRAALPRTTNDPKAVDLRHVEDALNAAVSPLVAQWGAVRSAQISSLVQQIRKIVASGNLSELADVRPTSPDGSEILHAAMTAIADTGAGHAAMELNNQGHHPPAIPATPEHGRLRKTAQARAALMASGLSLSAAQSTLKSWSPDASEEDVASSVEENLNGLSMSPVETALAGALMGAMNLARIATLDSTPGVDLYASEVLDGRTCNPCADVDGAFLGESGTAGDEAAKFYPDGQYGDCQGGDRCRGTVIGVTHGSESGE